MSVSTIHQLRLLPMMCISHCFGTIALRIALVLIAFCYNQICRGHIAMLRLLVLCWTGAISSGLVLLGVVVCLTVSLEMSHPLRLGST